jgi:hypothetical protein
VKKSTRIYCLAAERERFEITASFYVNIGGNGGGGLVSSGRSFLLGACCRPFSEAFSEEITRIYCLADERERFEIPASFPG